MDQQTYIIFDGDETEYQTLPPTNANIRNVLRICTQAAFKPDEERVHYAEEGDIPPDEFDKDGHPLYTLEGIFMPGTYWPALAQQLFFDCPEMVKVKSGEVKIVNRELYDNLNRAEVRRAFNTFLGKFGATPFEVKNLLNVWDNAQIRGIIQKMADMKQQTTDMNTQSEAGETDS